MLALLHLGLEGMTEVDTDPKRKFESFKFTPSNYRVICAPSAYSTREQLARGRFFEVYKIICKRKMIEMKTK